jgi:hypothetical protein
LSALIKDPLCKGQRLRQAVDSSLRWNDGGKVE